MKLRDYQQTALDAIHNEFGNHRRTLLVLPTGTGKTVVFAKLLEELVTDDQRGLVVAHREELIDQAADKIRRVAQLSVEVEMAERYATRDLGGLLTPAQVIVSSIQTQCAGCRGRGRMSQFSPQDFGIMVIDEAHHSPARTYQRTIDYYTQHERLRLLGVTATPDRADEQALGRVFESVAMVYEIDDAIGDGWLVPVRQHTIEVQDLDFSGIRTVAGDLNAGQLASVMEYEATLHGVARPTFEISDGRKTLLFAASVAHAERLCEIFNREVHDCARWVCGNTPKDERRKLFRDYRDGKFSILCNVGVATEGFDEPGIEVVAVARPTKSRALYAQMIGRGTRPLPGIVDEIEGDRKDRMAAIAASSKQHLTVLDFVGNSGQHQLITSADILGGKFDDDVIARATKAIKKAGADVDVSEELRKAARELAAEEEQESRRHILPKVKYRSEEVDPFKLFQVRPRRVRGWDKGRAITDRQRAFLEKRGIDCAKLDFTKASSLIGDLIRRMDEGLCTYKQARRLRMNGVDPRRLTFQEASAEITKIAERQGWNKSRKTG